MVASIMSQEDKISKIQQMQEQGKSLQEIGTEFGVNASTILRWLQKQEVVTQQESAQSKLLQELQLLQRESQQLREALQRANKDAQLLRNDLQESHSKEDLLRNELQSMQSNEELLRNELQVLQGELQQNKDWLQNAKNQVNQLQAKLQEKKASWFVDLFKKGWFQTLIVLIGGISTACAITAPIFIHVKTPDIWAYSLAIYVDIAAFIFILNNRHRLGRWFAANIAFQVFIKLGSALAAIQLFGIPNEQLVIVLLIGISLCISIGLATYGFADLILSLNKKEENEG